MEGMPQFKPSTPESETIPSNDNQAAAESTPESVFTEKYSSGQQYDFPIMPRPKFSEKGVEGTDGFKYDTYKAGGVKFKAIAQELGDNIVLLQTPNYWVEAIPASEVADRFATYSTELKENCMILIPSSN